MVRKIDDLGRIVIPKEVRRTLRINKGDPLELYIDSDGNIIFKKYSLMEEISKIINCLCETLYKVINLPVIICNKEQVIAVSGVSKKECLNRRLTPFILEELFSLNNEPYTYSNNKEPVAPIEGLKKEALIISPITFSGYLTGIIIILKNEQNKTRLSLEIITKTLEVATTFLSKISG